MKLTTYISLIGLAATATLALPLALNDTFVPAGLDKPIISPKFDMDGAMETQLRSVLSKAQIVGTKIWAAGTVPTACEVVSRSFGFSASNWEVLEVTYRDCAQTWQLCKDKRTKITWATILERFSQIPIGMRQWVSHVIVGLDDLIKYQAATVDTWSMFQEQFAMVGTMAHEFSHILDEKALTSQTSLAKFSDDPKWQSEQAKDSAIASLYGSSAWVENFAETGRLVISDLYVSGGLKSINPSADQIKFSVANFEKYLKSTIQSGNCAKKSPPTPPISVRDAPENKELMAKMAALESGKVGRGNI